MNTLPYNPEYHGQLPQPDNAARLGRVVTELSRVYDQILNESALHKFVIDPETEDEHTQLLLATVDGKKALYPLDQHPFLRIIQQNPIIKVIMLEDSEKFELVLSQEDETNFGYISLVSNNDEECSIALGERDADIYASDELHELDETIIQNIEQVANDFHMLFARHLNDPHADQLPQNVLSTTRPYTTTRHPSARTHAHTNN